MIPKAAMNTRSSRSEPVDDEADEAADIDRLTHGARHESIVWGFNTSRTRQHEYDEGIPRKRQASSRALRIADRSLDGTRKPTDCFVTTMMAWVWSINSLEPVITTRMQVITYLGQVNHLFNADLSNSRAPSPCELAGLTAQQILVVHCLRV